MKKEKWVLLLIFILIFSFCKSKKDIQVNYNGENADRRMFEEAQSKISRNPEEARQIFKTVMELFPSSIYARRSKIGIADAYYRQKDSASLIMAAAEYQEYVSLYPQSPDAVYAKNQVAMCYYKQVKKPGRDQTSTYTTLSHFENLIQQYPGTQEAEAAKGKITELRQRLAIHFYRIGKSNYILKSYHGALARFKSIIDDYPEFTRMDELFYYTGKSNMALGQLEAAQSFFQQIVNTYPKSKRLKKAKKNLKKINELLQKKSVPGKSKK